VRNSSISPAPLIVALVPRTSIRRMLRNVRLASLNASWAASFQLVSDTPSSSIVFSTATGGTFHLDSTGRIVAGRRDVHGILHLMTDPSAPASTEFGLIAELAPFLAGAQHGIAVGSGDDAAVLDLGDRWVCLAVDVIVEGVHFRSDLSSYADVGWKAVAVNCSDLAAMGARPTAAVVGLCRPPDLPVSDIEALYTGMDEACTRWGLRLVGGDTVAAEALALSVTVLGEVEPNRAVTRAHAEPGDAIVVVGSLGAAAAALSQVAHGRQPSAALLSAHRRPQALVAAGRALASHGARAMIDVSDGLGADLGHICAASGVAARVRWTALPIADGVLATAAEIGIDPVDVVCGGGEDFALLAAVPADLAEQAAQAASVAEGVTAVLVGVVGEPHADDEAAVVLEMPDGSTRDIGAAGYDHFGRAAT
jgi:thiamine-monophosphate kinase